MSKHSSLSNSPKVSEWLDFSQEGELILHTGKVDIGQRITTALALIAAEELSISFNQISVRKTKTDFDPNEGYTAGSFSMQHSGYAIKKATATARKIFTLKAAEKLNIAEDKLEVSDGQIRAKGTNQSLTYWELMSDVNLEIDPTFNLNNLIIEIDYFDQKGIIKRKNIIPLRYILNSKNNNNRTIV